MNLTTQIDSDAKSLERYFHKLFDVLEDAIVENASAPIESQDMEAIESRAAYYRISHFIKPDMLINIYNFLDFWLKEICNYQKRINKLKLEHKDIKASNDLLAYKKYLTEYVGLDLTSAENIYNQLDKLRKIRNRFIHNGGHISDNEVREFSKIDGISLYDSLIIVEERFIWEMLENAKYYLLVSAKA